MAYLLICKTCVLFFRSNNSGYKQTKNGLASNQAFSIRISISPLPRIMQMYVLMHALCLFLCYFCLFQFPKSLFHIYFKLVFHTVVKHRFIFKYICINHHGDGFNSIMTRFYAPTASDIIWFLWQISALFVYTRI